MDALLASFSTRPDTGGVEFWHGAERSGWLMKQGESGRRERGREEGIHFFACVFIGPRPHPLTRPHLVHSP